MDNEEIQGVKFSEFPFATPDNADEVVGLHAGDNARFSLANLMLAIRQGLVNLFVPQTRTVNNKALSSNITLDASDVGAVDTADVGVADGVASLDSNGKVPGTQLDLSGKQSTITANGILKGEGAGGVSAATPGTDYGTYSKPSGGIPASDIASGVIPSAYTSNPAMDGTASPGNSTAWARGDHVHPSDTSRADVTSYPSASVAVTDTTRLSAATLDSCQRVGNLAIVVLTLTIKAQIPTTRAAVAQLHGIPRTTQNVNGLMQITNYLFTEQLQPDGTLNLTSIGQAQGPNTGTWTGRVQIVYYTDGTLTA